MSLELLMTTLVTFLSTNGSAFQKKLAFCIERNIHYNSTSIEVPQESLKAGSNSKMICQNRHSVDTAKKKAGDFKPLPSHFGIIHRKLSNSAHTKFHRDMRPEPALLRKVISMSR